MKATKKKLLTTLIAACVVSGVAATVGIDYNASAETVTSGISSFEMAYGASVRKTAGSLGIRFTATFDETLYEAVAEDENKEFGMLITNNEWVEQYCTSGNYIADLISDKNYILITESEADEEAGNQLKPYVYATDEETGANTYAINGVVANVQYNHSNWSWFGIGVVITTNGSEKTYEYADYVTGDNVRTVAEVASAALEYEADKMNDTQKANVMEYVYSTAYDVQGVSKADYEAKTKEEKAAELATFTLAAGDTEYYATVGEEGVETSVTATNGEVSFPVRTKWTSSDEEVAVVNEQGILTATGRGYAVLTPTSSIGLTASATSATAYTGETTLITQNMKNDPVWLVAGNVGDQGSKGIIDGEEYLRWGKGTGNEANYYTFIPSDISSNYLAYMKSQGYGWVRSRAYFTNDTQNDINFRIMINAHSNGGSEKSNEISVPTNQWISIDIPLDLYLGVYWNNNEGVDKGDGTKYIEVDEYGMASRGGWSYSYRAPFVILTTKTTSYWGDVTLLKESATTVTVTENDVEAKFAENYDLSEKFTIADGEATYTVDGKDYYKEAFLPVFSKYEVGITANILHVNATIPVAAKADIQFTRPNTTATLNVTDGLETSAVNLVNTEETYDIDTLTGKTELEAAGLEAEYSIVKRYSDGTPMATLDVANAESGIYYYNVTVKKASETIATYTSTIDLYKESEGCEYESFKHSDSQYAIKSYLGCMSSVWLLSNGTNKIAVGDVTKNLHTVRSIDYLANYHTCDETCEEECDLLMSTTNATGPIYAMKFSEISDVAVTNYDTISKVGCVEFDWTTYGPSNYFDRYMGNLDVDGDGTNEAAIGSGQSYIYTYILPRHTKEYYQAKSNEYSELASAYKGNGQRERWAYVQKIENNNVVLNFTDNYSNSNFEAPCDLNIQSIIDNYDAFATGQIPMHIIYSPYTDINNPARTHRIYELFFVANA